MSVKVEVDRKQFARINRILNMVPDAVAFKVYDKCLKPAGEVVKQRAEELAPRSSATNGRKKMSNKSKAIWSSTPLAKLLGVKVLRGKRKGGSNPYALVGPKYPDGNKGNFVHPMVAQTRKRKYWGRDPVTAPAVTPKDNDFLKRASDETRPQQVRAFTRALIPEIRKAMKDLSRGN